MLENQRSWESRARWPGPEPEECCAWQEKRESSISIVRPSHMTMIVHMSSIIEAQRAHRPSVKVHHEVWHCPYSSTALDGLSLALFHHIYSTIRNKVGPKDMYTCVVIEAGISIILFQSLLLCLWYHSIFVVYLQLYKMAVCGERSCVYMWSEAQRKKEQIRVEMNECVDAK